MRDIFKLTLAVILSVCVCVSCTQEYREVESAYSDENETGEVKSVHFEIAGLSEDDFGTSDMITKSSLTPSGFVWSEKDTVGIFPSRGNQIFYEMSGGAGSSSASFDGGGWALKQNYSYWSYYPLRGDFYLDKKAIPVEYPTVVHQTGNDNSAHLGPSAYMYTSESTVSSGTLNFTYWQIGCVLKPKVTLPAGHYTKLVISTEKPVFVVSGTYDITTAVEDDPETSANEKFVPLVVPDEGNDGSKSLTNELTIELDDVIFTQETELVAYIMSAPVDLTNNPISFTIYEDGSPKYRYEREINMSLAPQNTYGIKPLAGGLTPVASSSESANAAFAEGVTSLELVDIPEDSELNLVLPSTNQAVNISMSVNDAPCTISLSYPTGSSAVPASISVRASSGSDLIIRTPESTVTLSGEDYDSVHAATADNTLIVQEGVTIGTLYLEKGNVEVYGTIAGLNTVDLEEGEKPTIYVYGTIQGQIENDDVTIRRPISAVTLNQTSLELEPSETVQLVATAVPENAIYETITWSSSNTSVATVSDAGLVTASASGECTITVDVDGKQATCRINVSEPTPEYVDLGLSVKWATFNVGATKPEQNGDYFAWGEIESKSSYGMQNYFFYRGSMIRYNQSDMKTELMISDDVAASKWGGNWRMPTNEEFAELIEYCTWRWIKVNDVYGYLVTSTIPGYTDKSIFLPASGHYEDSSLVSSGVSNFYWSSSLILDGTCYGAKNIAFSSVDVSCSSAGRWYGAAVRPIFFVAATGISLNSTSLNLTENKSFQLVPTLSPADCSNKRVYWESDDQDVATVDENGIVTAIHEGETYITVSWAGDSNLQESCHITVTPSVPEYVDLGLSVKWATFNLGAKKPEEYGDYYSWGETSPLNTTGGATISWQNYFDNPSGDGVTFSKYYCGNGGKLMLSLADDAANNAWGEGWRIPNDSEINELIKNCTWTWTTVNGISGYNVRSNVVGFTDNSIFLPAAGYYPWSGPIQDEGIGGYYRSSELRVAYDNNGYISNSAGELRLGSDSRQIQGQPRNRGLVIRPVYGDLVMATEVSLSKNSIEIREGDTYSVDAQVIPYSCCERGITWISSNPSVVTVEWPGKITAISSGSSTITAIWAGNSNIKATCTVTVIPVPEKVDLGLPSGIKWASFNLGASKPDEYGDYYAWGETEPYYEKGYAQSNSPIWKSDKSSGYIWSSYKWCNGSYGFMTKYCTNSSSGTVDNKTTLEMEDDAANVKLGGNWRIPTNDEFIELKTNCTWEWTSINGVSGYKVTSKKAGYTDKWIFIPAAGWRSTSSLSYDGEYGFYWTSSLYTVTPYRSYEICFYSSYIYSEHYDDRCDGRTIRPVCE